MLGCERAQQSGFEVQITKKYSSDPPGTVLASTPSAGTQLEAGSKVHLVVAKALPMVPNVVGLQLTTARLNLKDRGFKVRVKKQATSSHPSGSVISQSPPADKGARPGSTVTLGRSIGSSGGSISPIGRTLAWA